MLSLRKKQNPSAGPGRIHRRTDQSISADGKNHDIGSAPFALRLGHCDHVFVRSIDWM